MPKRLVAVLLILFILIAAPPRGSALASVRRGWADADSDGTVTASDARLLLRISLGSDSSPLPGSPDFAVCDCVKDGEITAADARQALRVAVELDRPFFVTVTDVDGSLEPWMRDAAVRVFMTAFPETDTMLGPAGIEVVIRGMRMDGVAYTSGSEITFSTAYLAAHPKDIDFITHELAHVSQAYPAGAPSWLTEGIADYARDLFGLGNDEAGWALPDRPTGRYTDGYNTSAAFLKWADERYPGCVRAVNSELKSGTYSDSIWVALTGRDLEELWRDCCA